MEFKCAHSHFYIISPLNVCASIYYLLKIQPAGCYKHGTLLAVFTHRYGCCRNSLAGSGPGFQELLCFTKQGSLFIQICVCKCVCSVTQSCLALSSPTGSNPPVLLLMVFSRQEPWSELPFLSPGDLPNLGTEVASLESPPLQWILPVCHLGSPSTPITTVFYLLHEVTVYAPPPSEADHLAVPICREKSLRVREMTATL